MARPRIQVGPAGLAYLVVTGLVLLTALVTQRNLLLAVFALMCGGWVASLAYLALALRRLEVQRVLPEHGVAGQAVAFAYRLRNGNRLLPLFSLVIQESWGRDGWRGPGWKRLGPVAEEPRRLAHPPTTWLPHLGPGQEAVARATVRPLRRGELSLERVTVSTGFPFGLMQARVQVPLPRSWLVYPHLHDLAARVWHGIAAMESMGRLRLRRPGGEDEFYGLRRYRPGDSQRSIDWRHSARIGELICRESIAAGAPRVMLVLDLPAAGPDDPGQVLAEQAIDLAASVVAGAYLRGLEVGLAAGGGAGLAFRMGRSLAHRNRMLEALARLDLAATPADRSPPAAAGPAPSVIVRPGVAEGLGRSGRCLVLAAGQLTHYLAGAAAQGMPPRLLLADRPLSRAERRRLGRTPSWT